MDLSFETGRLPALAGIAAQLSKTLGFTYPAGIWKEDLAHGMCWYVCQCKEEIDGNDRDPSWSWISANRVVQHSGEKQWL